MNTWRRKLLALLSVPLLAVPSAVGVYLWLVPHIGPAAAAMTAAGFEALYIGINILVITTPELRRYARNVALCAVATAITFNTLARYQTMVGGNLRIVPLDILALGLAVLESIPLAGLAYAVSVLLHRLSEADVRERAVDVQLRAEIAQRDEETARLRADFARQTEDATQAQQAIARHRAELAERDATIARLREEIAQASLAGELDILAVAQALRAPRAASWREIEELLKVAQSTLRSRLDSHERRNGEGVGA